MRAALLACAATVAACGGGDDAPPLVAIPTVHGLEVDLPYYTAVGDEAVIEVTLRDDAGAIVDTPFEWLVTDGSPRAYPATWSADEPSPGVHRLRFTPQFPATSYVRIRLTGEDEHGQIGEDTDVARVLAYGGPPSHVLAYAATSTLAIGEARPIAAMPVAAIETKVVHGHEPVTYASANPAIATVDTRGVVTGVAVGSTTLTVRHGDTSATVAVEVTAAALAAPAADARLPVAGVESGPGLAWLTPTATEDTIVVDARGHPHLAYQGRAPGELGQALVASWTGTGFGVEVVSRAYEQVDQVKAVLDEQGRLHLVYFDLWRPGFVHATRDAAAGPDAWTRQLLATDVDALVASGYHGHESYADGARAAILAREGGGVWIATRAIHVDSPTSECVELIRLFEVAPDGIRRGDVRERRWPYANISIDCGDDFIVNWEPLGLVARDGMVPDVITTLDGEGLVGLRASGDAWTRELLLPADDPGSAGRVHQLQRFVVARAQEPGQVDRIFAGYCNFETPWDPPHLALVGVDGPRWSLGGDQPCNGAFAFHAGTYLYAGAASASAVVRTAPFAGGHNESLFGGFDDPPGYYEHFGGVTVAGDVAFVRYGTSVSTIALPPAPAQPTDGELAGMRLGGGAETSWVQHAPVVRADGRRYLFSEWTGTDVSGELWTSAGPGQPWTVVDRRVDNQGLNYVARAWEVPGALFAMRHVLSGEAPQFARSVDGGATWLLWGSIPVAQPVRAHHVTPEGAALVVLDEGNGHAIYHAAAVQTDPSFTRIAGLPAAVAADHVIWDLDDDRAVIQLGDTLYVVSLLIHSNTSGRRILIQRVGTDGGDRGHVLLDPQTGLDTVAVARAAIAGDGTLYVPVWTSGHLVHPRVLLAIDPATGAFTRETPITDGHLDLRLARLADGRMAAAWSRPDVKHRRRAVYAVRGAGGWSAPVVLRPGGGRTQLVDAIAAEPDGGLLMVIADNHAITPLIGRPPGGPPADRLVIRVPSP